jgi:hypothetical protein
MLTLTEIKNIKMYSDSEYSYFSHVFVILCTLHTFQVNVEIIIRETGYNGMG